MYRETRIPRLHATVWMSRSDAVEPVTSIIVPDGCMDLILLDIAEVGPPDGAARGRFAEVGSLAALTSEIIIAGADTAAREFRAGAGTSVGLRFDPGVLPQLVRTSATELADQVLPLDSVLPIARGFESVGIKPIIGQSGSGLRRTGSSGGEFGSMTRWSRSVDPWNPVRRLIALAEVLLDAVALDRRPLALARSLGGWSPAGSRPARTSAAAPLGHPRAVGTVDRSPLSISEAAAEFSYSPRQLRRLSAQWFGYGPKHLSKILRWQSARELLAEGYTRASAAAVSGYADAAHLWRDERSLLGR